MDTVPVYDTKTIEKEKNSINTLNTEIRSQQEQIDEHQASIEIYIQKLSDKDA